MIGLEARCDVTKSRIRASLKLRFEVNTENLSPFSRWMWKHPSGVKLCTYFILHSEGQTSKWSNNKHSRHGGGCFNITVKAWRRGKKQNERQKKMQQQKKPKQISLSLTSVSGDHGKVPLLDDPLANRGDGRSPTCPLNPTSSPWISPLLLSAPSPLLSLLSELQR